MDKKLDRFCPKQKISTKTKQSRLSSRTSMATLRWWFPIRFFSSLVAQLQSELDAIDYEGEDLCPLIRNYIGHFRHRLSTNTQKLIILGLASFHLLKELFQLTQVWKWIKILVLPPWSLEQTLFTHDCCQLVIWTRQTVPSWRDFFIIHSIIHWLFLERHSKNAP